MAVPTSETFEAWREGHVPIRHREETVQRMKALTVSDRVEPDRLYRLLAAAAACTPRSCDEWVACADRNAIDGLGSPADLAATRH